jgi:hypothetical protein
MTFAATKDDWLDPDIHDAQLEEPEIDIDEEAEALPAEPEPEFDLDALLEESLAQADARKRQRQGRKLSAEQADLVEQVERVLTWSPVAQVALFRRNVCTCGAAATEFVGWYSVLRHRREAGTRRLSLVTQREPGIPAFSYNILDQVSECPACLSQLEEATFTEIEQWGLSTLGQLDFSVTTSFDLAEAVRETPLPCRIFVWPDGQWLRPTPECRCPEGVEEFEVEGCGSDEEVDEAVMDYLNGDEECPK